MATIQFRSACGASILAVSVGLTPIACRPPEPAAPQAGAGDGAVVLARIGDDVVTLDDLGGASPETADTVRRLEGLLQRKIVAWEARRRGLDQQPSTLAEIARVRREAEGKVEGLLRNALYNEYRLGMTVSEQDVLDHYEKQKDRYRERQWTFRIERYADEATARAAVAKSGAGVEPVRVQKRGPIALEAIPRGMLPILHELRQPGDRRYVLLDVLPSVVELVELQLAAQIPLAEVRDKVEASFRAVRARELVIEEIKKLRLEQVKVDTVAVERVSAEAKQKPDGEPAKP